MCGVLKLICVLACLLGVPATPQTQQDRRKESGARCRKPCFQEILKKLDKNGLGIYEVQKEVKENGEGIYEVKDKVKENGQGIYAVRKGVEENGEVIYEVRKEVLDIGKRIEEVVKSEVEEIGRRIEEVDFRLGSFFKDLISEVKKNGKGIDEIKTKVWENGENIDVIIDLIEQVEITISSTGPSAITQGSRMGKYELVPTLSSNNKPVYKQKDGDNYIYQHVYGYWWVGLVVGVNTGGIYSEKPSETIPTWGWYYWTDTAWKADPGLKFSFTGGAVSRNLQISARTVLDDEENMNMTISPTNNLHTNGTAIHL